MTRFNAGFPAGWRVMLVLIALLAGGISLAREMGEAQVMTPRLYRVIVPVRGIATAVEFYSGLFEMGGERVSPGRHYFDLGGTILALYDPAADGDPEAEWKYHPNQYVYVAVADVDAAFQRARDLGAELLSERVESMPWGERLFYARDPSGNPICLVDAETTFLGRSD